MNFARKRLLVRFNLRLFVEHRNIYKWARITKLTMIKADLHNHLGKNGANPGFDETIDIFHGNLGPNSIFGIANSNDYRYEDFIEQSGGKYNREHIGDDKRAVYVPEKKILVVKDQEMFTKKGHVLAIAMPYGRNNVETTDTRDAIKAAKDLGAILDAVHPFYFEGAGKFLAENPKLLEHFSSWEVYNGSAELWVPGVTPRNTNSKAIEFYVNEIEPNSNLNIGMSSSTDGHLVRTLGKCYTELEDFDLTSPNIRNELNLRLSTMKSMDRLYMQPNKGDAFQHAFNMMLVKLGLVKST